MSKQKTPQKRERAKLITQHEFVLLSQHIEAGGGESMTVPDESMSIREIMRKHVTGMRVMETLHRTGHYEDEVDFDSHDFEKVTKMDLSERQALSEQTLNQIKNLEETEKNRKKAAEQRIKDQLKEAEKEKSDKNRAKGGSEATEQSERDNPTK